MPNGSGSTLVIHPDGLSDVTLGLAGTGTYQVPLQTVDFNEDLRRQIIYDQAPPGEGGSAVGWFGPLVPVTFVVVIKADTRASMISAYNTLQSALLNNRGGTIEFKPEDVGDSALSTFYHYVKSSPPRLRRDRSGNRWDASEKSDDKYTLYVDVEMLTQPAATSDPDSPSTLSDLNGVTLDNWVDSGESQDNSVTIQSSNLKGSLPALVRFLVQPAAGQYLGRLIIFRRSDGTIGNFASVYEAEDSANIYPAVDWTEVADTDRGGDSYLRFQPFTDASEDPTTAQGRRFTISNPSDHRGRFAVFGVAYDGADELGVFTHQAKLVCGNVIQEGRDDWQADQLKAWGLLYVGEFELPPVPLSDAETAYDTGPYLDWYTVRDLDGEDPDDPPEFRLDAILLVFVSDRDVREGTSLDVDCDDEGGVVNTEKLLVENFPDDFGIIAEIAHVVAASDSDFKRALSTAPRGDFITLPTDRDSLLVFIQEQASGRTILDDDFSGYGLRLREVVSFDSDETWTATTGNAGSNTSDRSEGDEAQVLEPVYDSPGVYIGEMETEFSEAVDLSSDGRFTDDDYLAVWIEITQGDLADVAGVTVAFEDSSGNQTVFPFTPDQVAGAYVTKKSAHSSDSVDWTDITKVVVKVITTANLMNILFDFFRIEKADPDDAATSNATGDQWNVQPEDGAWTVTQDVTGAGRTLACLDVDSGVEKVALIDETTPGDVQFRARVRAMRDAGYVGIVWRAGNDTLTEGTEDCYAALLDISNDDLLVREYANGSVTQHDNPAFTCAIDTWYVVGVVTEGSTFKVYATAASNLSDDDDVFCDDYLLSTVTDSTLSSGKCGVMSVSTLGRFDEAKLVSLQDRVVPADQITVTGQAIYRTIAPFHE